MTQSVVGSPVSLISCQLDIETAELGSISVDEENGVAGKYKVGYIIQMADKCGPITVIQQAQAAGGGNATLPTKWATYSYLNDRDDKSYAKSFSVQRNPKKTSLCYVTVNYEPAAPGEIPDGGGAPIDSHTVPTERKPRIWWERQVTSSLRGTDVNGYVVTNYANTLYDDLIEHDRTKGVLVAEVNLASAAAAIPYERTYGNAVNSIAWTFRGQTIEPRAALIREVLAGQPRSEGAFTFCPTQFRMAFADIGKTWDDVLPEMSQSHFTKTGGNYDTDPTTGQRKITLTGRSVPLSTDGTRLPDGQQILTRAWATRKQADFNNLTFLNT